MDLNENLKAFMVFIGTIIFVVVMINYTTSTSHFVCNNQVCSVDNYSLLGKKISTKSINLNNIKEFTVVEQRSRRSSGYKYCIDYKDLNNLRQRFFKSCSTNKNKTYDLADELNDKIKSENKDIDVAFPHSLQSQSFPILKILGVALLIFIVYKIKTR